MKIAKKVLKTIGVLLGFIVVIVLGYIIYLYASYHRIEDNKSLSVESHTETKQTLTTGKQYSAITYNIGFGAYTPDFSFFMDGGKSSWAKSKKSVLKTVKNAGNLTKSYESGFCLNRGSRFLITRSYHVNEYSILKKCLKNYDTVFAQNYDSAFSILSIHTATWKQQSRISVIFQISDQRFTKKKSSDFNIIQ